MHDECYGSGRGDGPFAYCEISVRESQRKSARHGHLRIMNVLYASAEQFKVSPVCTYAVVNFAAENGHIDVLEWLYNHNLRDHTEHAMDWAAENGKLDAIKWLDRKLHAPCTRHAIRHARWHGHRDVVNWLRLNRATESRCRRSFID
jgi:hypothetical protein